VALREIANGCADALDEPRATDRLRAFEARVDAFADVLREVATRGEAERMQTEERYRPQREQWGMTYRLAEINRMLEALTDEVQS
jgi:hypothetical protein